MSSVDCKYVGAEYLQLGDSILTNYNRAIASLVCKYGRGASSVVDFGAGIGTLTDKVRANGLTPQCIEPDKAQREILERRGFAAFGSAEELADESVDFIYSSNVLEHIDDDVATLRRLRAKLKPGGKLLLYLPAFQSLYSAMDAEVGHFRRYDKAMLSQKLSAAGFDVQYTSYVDLLGYFVTRVFQLFGNNTTNINSSALVTYDRVVFPLSRMIESVLRAPVGKNVLAVAKKPV